MQKISSILPAVVRDNQKLESPIEKILYYELQRFGAKAELQHFAHGIRCDLVFPEKKLVIECDGKEYHKDKLRDIARDKILTDRGWIVIRKTGSEIFINKTQCAYNIILNYFPELHENKNFMSMMEIKSIPNEGNL